MEAVKPAMANPENGFPFLERMAKTSPIIARTKPTINPIGKQQQLSKIEKIPKTKLVTDMGSVGSFGTCAVGWF